MGTNGKVSDEFNQPRAADVVDLQAYRRRRQGRSTPIVGFPRQRRPQLRLVHNANDDPRGVVDPLR